MSKTAPGTAKPMAGLLTIAKFSLDHRYIGGLVRAARVAAGVLVAVILIQIAYPRSFVRPLARINNQKVGLLSEKALDKKLEQMNSVPVLLRTSQAAYRITPSEIGVRVDTQVTNNSVLSYSWIERLVPFSLFRKPNYSVSINTDGQKLDNFVGKIIADNKKPAKNASFTRQSDGSYKVVESQSGIIYEAESLKNTLKSLVIGIKAEVVVPNNSVEPPITTQKLNKAISYIEALKNQSFKVAFKNDTHEVIGAQLVKWVNISVNEANGQVSITYDTVAISAWVKEKASIYYDAAEPSVVRTIDGSAVGTSNGNAGQAVDIQQTVAAITGSLSTNQLTAQAKIIAISPSKQVIKSYSSTSRGLQLLIEEWQREQGRAIVGVVFQELGGQNRAAAVNPGQTFFAASFYKLYVAHYLLSKIASGQLDPNAPLQGGRSIWGCVEAMIVVSDSPCPETAVATYGWSTVHDFARATGFSSTTLAGGNIRTSAGDTASFMTRLAQGNLLNSSQTGSTLEWMKRQKYRSAIPAGVSIGTVADKVGFYNGSWHDAAIVYGTKVNYVLVVMSDGVGPGSIANLTKRIQDTLGQ